MRITAEDMQQFGIVDAIVPEPIGGAHRDTATMAQALRDALDGALDDVLQLGIPELLEARYQRYRNLGPFAEEASS
jgi:acetyl-CoA carboxylase carboxyl transferase subunit alpha